MSTPQRKVFDVRFTILVSLHVATLAALVFTQLQRRAERESQGSDSRAEQVREIGARLQSAGLAREAAAQYAHALELSGIHGAARAKLAFAVAELHEQDGQPEQALARYYEVEQADPKGELKTEAARRIVSLLESLNKVTAAKQALAESTQLGGNTAAAPPKGSVAIARIGTRDVYLADVQAAVDELPPAVKKEVETKAGRSQFLQRYVAEEVLRQKAERLGHAETPAFKRRMALVQRQLLVQKVVEDEVIGKVTVDEGDLKNYFEANKQKYVSKDHAQPTLADARQAVETDYRMMKTQAQYQKVVEAALTHEDVKLFPEKWQ